MDNIRAVIGILFNHVSVQEVQKEEIRYNNIPLQTFEILANEYMTRCSNDEIHNLYYFLKSELKWMKHKNYYEEDDGKEGTEINVFDVLYLFDGEVLTEENGQPVCEYLHFLRWHEMTKEIGEDIFITSYLAFQDVHGRNKRKNFFWKPVIGHNSRALNKVLEKGVAENHFHLKGSAPLFHISWISLMNDVINPDFKDALEQGDKRRLKRNAAYQGGYMEESLYSLYLKAACIRIYLFKWIKGIDSGLTKDLLDYIYSPLELVQHVGELQQEIELYQEFYGTEYDYAICETDLATNPDHHLNEILAGERWLMYEVFYKIYSRECEGDALCQLFYLYLIIKNILRSEIVQVNENIGFDNFLLYQNRKEWFIENTKYYDVFLKMAVKDTILNQHIEKLEARITPKETAEKNLSYIKNMDEIISGDDETMKDKFFYVMHFIKEKDEFTDEVGRCRHYEKRKSGEKIAKALAEFREKYPEYAERVRGLDASATEIWCRPEVFAQVFRFLRNHGRMDSDIIQLRYTYHVGEDFLDVVDGLRAIDEVISYLNFQCGDRLGHALALGIDIDEWYNKKANLLLIGRMDYLDNLVWLYGKIRKYRLVGCEDTINHIKKRYNELIKLIYKNHVKNSGFEFSIESYYDSWKLRGDNPYNYIDGRFKVEDICLDEWDYHAINRKYPSNYRIRYDKETAYLYYLYHFNPEIKKTGQERMEVHVNPAIVKAVKMIQKRMQIEICERGIGIETNPSSNCSIGSFKRYDRHPISKWYNLGLTNNCEELETCPQLLVTINTDDQGVFNTYLENEYAYLALALEKLKNEDGTPKYKRTMILQWLDNIRKMGLEQSFL